MKKVLSIALALIVALSLSVTAFAADGDNTFGPAETNGKSTEVKYTVDAAYTVTIPASVTLGGTATVSASGVKVAKGSQVVAKLTGTSEDDNAFKVKTAEGAALAYTVKSGTTAIGVGQPILTVNPDSATDGNGASGSATLTFTLDDTVKYAGEYTGTVTFTVSVEEAQKPSQTPTTTAGDEEPQGT